MSAPEPGVDVAYAQPDRQRIVRVALRDGMTAGDAVAASGLTVEFPELAARPLLLGIYGRRVEAAQLLRDGDRVEIYRELRTDPREARRRAVQQARAGRGAGRGR
jgi:putative ubiquitin-RnfH superfamily antitoxin RatB of RatAB toxin-antitoxin module